MKGTAKKILQKLLVNDVSYKILSPLIYIGDRLKASRINYKNAGNDERLEAAAKNIFFAETVCNGPFKGLHFTSGGSTASATYAKLLGSYESEIHPFIQKVIQRKYDGIINIGCDDGYYALGLARLMPGLKVKAYDSNPGAIEIARELVIINDMAGQVIFGGAFSASDIEKLKIDERIFFIVDCEGEERNIFTPHTVSRLRNADILVELHLHIHPDLEAYFRELFRETHHIEIVNAIDDHLKARDYDYPETANVSYELKRFITREREMFMQWMLLSAKTGLV